MPLVESAAATAVFNALNAAQDYGSAGPAQIAQAQAQLQVIANAFAKCIPHLKTFGVAHTVDTCTVAGAVVPPGTPTAGAVTGSGARSGPGSVTGLVKGDALSGAGLAGAIQAVLESAISPIPGADVDGAKSELAKLANACAEFAPYVMANATITTTVTGVAITLGVNGPTTGTGQGPIA